MLAYYVIWRMKRDLAPMLFKDDDPAAAAAERSSPVAKAKVSPAARRKAINKRTEAGQPVHSFRTLLQDLASLTRNSVRFGDARPTTILARPTPIQTRAFDPPRPQDRRVGRKRSALFSLINDLRSKASEVRLKRPFVGADLHHGQLSKSWGLTAASSCEPPSGTGRRVILCRADGRSVGSRASSTSRRRVVSDRVANLVFRGDYSPLRPLIAEGH